MALKPWGSPFRLEPRDRYNETERERATFIATSALDLNQQRAQRAATPIAPPPPPKPKKKNPLQKAIGAVDRITPEWSETGAKKTFNAVDAVGDFTTGALTAPFGNLEASPTGEVSRRFSRGSILQGLRESGKEIAMNRSPVAILGMARAGLERTNDERSFREANGQKTGNVLQELRRQGQEWESAKGVPTALRIGVRAAADPTNLIPVGTVGKALKFAPEAVQASRGAKVASALLETGPKVALGSAAGAGAGAYVADKIGAPEWVGQTAGAIAGGTWAGKTAAARARAKTGVLSAVEDGGESGAKLLGTQVLKNDELTTKPGLFQARGHDVGSSVSKSKVDEMVAKWDPTQLTPGLVAKDTKTGEYTIISGHHRQAAMKQLGIPEAEWRVVEADLSDPKQLSYLMTTADAENLNTATTSLAENVAMYRRAKEAGKSPDEIQDTLRSIDKKTTRNYMEAISALPDDIIRRADEAAMPVQNLGMIAKNAKKYNWDEADLRAIFGRYGPTGKLAGITATQLDANLTRLGRTGTLSKLKGIEGFTGSDWDATKVKVFDAADELDEMDASLEKQRKKLVTASNTAKEQGTPAAEAYRVELQAKMESLQAKRASLEADYIAARNAATDTNSPIAVGDYVEHNGAPAKVTEVKDGAVRVEPETGEPAWIQTGPDMFGESAKLKKVQPPSNVQATASPVAGPQTSLPMVVPAAPPPPRPGSSAGNGGGLGIAGQPPTTPKTQRKVDLFDTIDFGARLAEETKHQGTVVGKVDTGLRAGLKKLGMETFDKNLKGGVEKVFTVKEANRLKNVRTSYVAHADDLYMKLMNTDIPIKKQGMVSRMPNGAAFEDMFEGKTADGVAAFNALTKEQKDAIQVLRDFNNDLNGNIRFHNRSGTTGWLDEEDYFPRMALGQNGDPYVRLDTGGGGGSLGTTPRNALERTFDQSIEDGLKAGVDYSDPRNAWKAMVNAKLKMAADQAIARRLEPFSLTEKQLPQGSKIGIDYVALPMDVAPTLSGRYFEPEMAARIREALTDNDAVAVKFISEFNRRATPLRATADWSWFLQTGLPMIYQHPVGAIKGAWMAGFGDRKAYDAMMQKLVDRGFDVEDAIRHGLHHSADDLGPNDYGVVKARALTKPGLKQVGEAYNKVADYSNKSFSRYMNWTRQNFAADAQERMYKLKGSMPADQWRKEYQGAMAAVNRISGNTGRDPSSLEKMFAFAPRYTSATIEQAAAMVTKHGLERQLAIEHITRMLFTGAMAVYVGNALATGDWSVKGGATTFDPRSANFLRFRNVGGLDVSPLGTYDTLIRALATTALGDKGEPMGPDATKLWKLAEGKMSPALKVVYEPFIKKSTFKGEPLNPSSIKGYPKIIGNAALNALPFSASNLVGEGIIPSIKEKSAKPFIDNLPGFAVSGVGATNSPVTPTEYRNWRRDSVAQEKFGKKYDDLATGTEKSIVNEDKKVSKYQAEADKNTMTRGDDLSINQQASIEHLKSVEALTKRFEAKEINGGEFRQTYRDLQNRQRGTRDVLKQRQSDPEIEGYFKLFDQVTRGDKSLDYDALEPLLQEYEAKHPGVVAKIDAITGVRDNATMREFRVAREQAQEYYKLPAYQGLTVEEGDRIAPILAEAKALVANQQAVDYKHALKQMADAGAIEQSDIILGVRATRGGTSQERKAYRTSHPEYAKFYTNYSTTIGDTEAPALGTYASGGSKPKASRRRVGVRRLSRR